MATLENKPVLNHLDHINSLLHNAVLKYRAAIKVPADHPKTPLIKKDYIAPGQNLQHQSQRFTKTTQAPGRKKTGLVLR